MEALKTSIVNAALTDPNAASGLSSVVALQNLALQLQYNLLNLDASSIIPQVSTLERALQQLNTAWSLYQVAASSTTTAEPSTTVTTSTAVACKVTFYQ